MAVKKKRIQVPESIAEEVKLFAKLLELGEITSVYDLLRELESRGEKEGKKKDFNLYDVRTREILWSAVVSEIYPPTTQAIFAQRGRLISLNNNGALIEINSPQLVRLTYSRIPHLEAAFKSVLGEKVKVQIVPRAKPSNHVL